MVISLKIGDMMQDNSIVKYQFSRVPQITTATFQTKSESSDPDIIKSRDQLEEELKMWYMMFIDKIRGGGHISVAELRRKAGLDVEFTDYLFGFDEDCLAYTGTHGLELIKFHPVHLKQILEPNYKIIDFEDLAEVSATDAEYEQAFLQYANVTDDAIVRQNIVCNIKKYIM
jgi:hypothetical protein